MLLSIDPERAKHLDLVSARIGAAIGLIKQGRIEEAKKYLMCVSAYYDQSTDELAAEVEMELENLLELWRMYA